MVLVKLPLLATILILAKEHTVAFTPVVIRGQSHVVRSASESGSADLTIEYDAAAKLAYTEWREQYGKGDFDSSRYDAFKANYEALTIANIIAAKEATASGEDYEMLDLNEFADMTAEEYMANGDAENVSGEAPTNDVMETIMETSAAQEEASNAIDEASAAVAEEEQKLAEKLGLESVEDLEAAIDAIDGIAEDGTEVDTTNSSEDVDVRSAYLSWCEEFGKEIDEAKYPNFMLNYLAAYNLAKESGNEMTLNMYADLTEAEFVAATNGSAVVDTGPSAEDIAKARAKEEATLAEVKANEEAAARALAEEKKKKEEESAAKLEKEREAMLKADEAAKKKAQEANKKRIADANAKRAEITKAVEDDKKKRQSAQDKALADAKAATEASAIAAAKAAAEQDAIREAKTREYEQMANELVLKKAKEAEEKLASLRPVTKAPPTPATPPPSPVLKAIQSLPKLKPMKSAPATKEKPRPPATKEKPRPISASKKANKLVKRSDDGDEPIWLSLLKKAAEATAAAIAEASSESSEKAPKRIPKPVAAPKPTKKKAPVPQMGGTFTIKKAKDEQSLVAKKVVPPVRKNSWNTFIIKKATEENDKPKAPPARKAVAKKSVIKKETAKPVRNSWNIFKSKAPVKAKKSPISKEAAKPLNKKSWGTFNIKATTTPPKSEPKAAPAKGKWGTLNIKAATTKDIATTKPTPKKSGRFSFFKSKSSNQAQSSAKDKKKSPNDGIPVLSSWVREEDGSVTGSITNSPDYRPGQTITTSPIRGVVGAGRVVVTSSGSKYRLNEEAKVAEKKKMFMF